MLMLVRGMDLLGGISNRLQSFSYFKKEIDDPESIDPESIYHALDKALHVEFVNEQEIDRLVEKVRSLEIKDRYGRQAIHIAALNNNTLVVNSLIERGVAVDTVDKAGRTALHLAAMKGFEFLTFHLLKSGASIDAKDRAGRAALHHASANGQKNVVHFLVKRGARINERDGCLRTPIYHAALHGHMSSVNILSHLGADRNAHFPLEAELRSSALPFPVKKSWERRKSLNALLASSELRKNRPSSCQAKRTNIIKRIFLLFLEIFRSYRSESQQRNLYRNLYRNRPLACASCMLTERLDSLVEDKAYGIVFHIYNIVLNKFKFNNADSSESIFSCFSRPSLSLSIKWKIYFTFSV